MKSSTSTTIFIILCIFPFGSALIRFVLDEEITKCSDDPWLIDLSEFELIMINDTTTIANGSCVLEVPIDSPWKLFFYGEQFYRGQWLKKFERKFDDFCKYILRPGEFWYTPFDKKLHSKGCPYDKGQVFPADEDNVYFDMRFMPSSFQGRWRFSIDGYLGCYRVHFDFVDD